MIQVEGTTYNPDKDGIIPIVAGTYPAHVSGLEVKEITVKSGEKKQVFNATFLIDESVNKMTVVKLVKNDKGEYGPVKDGGSNKEIPASFMNGKKFNSIGLWFTQEPSEDKRWQNRKYVEFFENLGIQFPKNEDGDSELAIIEEDDIIGKPCFVKLNKETYEKNDEIRHAWKVFEAFPWKDGVTLDSDEVKTDDLPF